MSVMALPSRMVLELGEPEPLFEALQVQVQQYVNGWVMSNQRRFAAVYHMISTTACTLAHQIVIPAACTLQTGRRPAGRQAGKQATTCMCERASSVLSDWGAQHSVAVNSRQQANQSAVPPPHSQ